ncbi:MAG: hypothetical protein AB3N18_07700, partial [Allomuricauda sp.]
MASIRLITRTDKNPAPLYIRFIHGRKLDIFYNTKVLVNPDHWDNKEGNLKNLKAIRNRLFQFSRFEKLKSHIVYEFNEAYMVGKVIDREWLETTVNEFFDRPVTEHNLRIQEHLLYYGLYVEWWLENKSKTWRTAKNQYLSHRAIQQYESFQELWKKYRKGKGKIKIMNVDSIAIGGFVDYMENENYSMATIKRHISRL